MLPPGMGIGGFIARPRGGRGIMRPRGLGRATAMGRGGLTAAECADERRKNKRVIKKKSHSLEEAFPAYLQEAFFGRPVLDQSCDTDRFELDESMASDEEAGLFSDAPETKSLIEVKDPLVMQEAGVQRLAPLGHANSIMSPKQPPILAGASQVSSEQLYVSGVLNERFMIYS